MRYMGKITDPKDLTTKEYVDAALPVYEGQQGEVLGFIQDNVVGAMDLQLDRKADKVTSATNGDFAGLDANGNLTDSGKSAVDFATAAQGAKADSAYQKPDAGIPSTDMTTDVQTSLGKADTAIQTPASPVTGQYLKKTADGWETSAVDALPSQEGQSGKYLTTDGSVASWGTIDLSSKADVAAPELTTKVESEVTLYPRAVTIGGTSTPDTTDNSENIATTKWVQNLLNKVVGYDVDPSSGTLSVSPLDTIANNQLTLVSNAATIEHVAGDEYAFNIVV